MRELAAQRFFSFVVWEMKWRETADMWVQDHARHHQQRQMLHKDGWNTEWIKRRPEMPTGPGSNRMKRIK
ncbi:hypothetical protein P152DRAFT_176970 [Eremomyces bilateralis CBS 781.70]|uniref:Uncharacterized protein n=1 Tax=Eremomyces bilateralis CBS 781.70 TaxID=1392243 RepID=A0A6G1FSU9_9PEZI|nr:uncharacterized protein P152DRAFT_176970 [Eremomyces bilateralis CBS 781.70]KAF1808945.1 hypothetical protein P152DRAFT_176970 [Eremomyces bilateralis CBS 781.70]